MARKVKITENEKVSLQEDFYKAGERNWYDMLICQTECVCKPFEEFCKEMARYIFIAEKT